MRGATPFVYTLCVNMSFKEKLKFDRDEYREFKRDEIMTGFNLSVEGMKFTFHCGKMDTATGLVLSHDPISHKAIVLGHLRKLVFDDANSPDNVRPVSQCCICRRGRV